MINERIKIERKRLGLSQAEFSDKCGASLRAQSNYESGKNVPDGNYFMKAHELGVDITYIITGVPAKDSLTTEESNLLQEFRNLSDEQKKLMLGFLTAGFDGFNAAKEDK